ncbi:hypothetical protein [Mariniphaga sp.]|uniref:hypothetical protein n=1 Tax=Mariniphaga sp. TaxID=1954475 RepID=UPI00356715C1
MKNFGYIIITVLLVLLLSESGFSQPNSDSTSLSFFIKKELNTGAVFSFDAAREEFRTDKTRKFEEITKGFTGFRWENRNWIFLPYRQENWNILFEAGPYYGEGDWIDSAKVQAIGAEQKLTGIKGKLQANYTSRFYFDQKNYTIVSVNAWGLYGLFRRNASGFQTDSNQVTIPYNEKSEHSNLRYGFQAKAGWGMGRLNPMNHYMAANWLLEKYYPGRLFSEEEILKVAREIGRIKHQRNARIGHSAENERDQIGDFLKKELLLKSPGMVLSDWQLTEFRPRFNGSRIEFGPFFNYFNREPDFVYGGYLKFENHKYYSLKRNRNISASLSYNGYKRKDWILLETDLGWSFYPNLKTEYGFGVKYIPGLVVNGFDDIGPVRHNFVPYLEYFSQMNSKYRIETALAWRIVSNDQFMLPGPEVMVSVYRSRY